LNSNPHTFYLKWLNIVLLVGSLLFVQGRLLAKPMVAQGLEQQAQAAQQVIQKTPKSAEAYYNLGLSYHYAIDLEKAIVAYQEAIRLNPKYDSPYINLGLLRLQIGQADEAEQLFRKVLTLPDRYENPASSHTIAHYNLAVILSRKGQKQEALASVQQALAITPNFAPAQKLLTQLK
jgi:tetratricopeptide (TPR) repeat protein